LAFGVYTAVFVSRSIAVDAEVVALSAVPSQEDNSTNFAPTFVFKAEDGRIYTVTSAVATNPPEFEVGERVRAVYIRSSPGSAKLDSFLQLWFGTIVCVGLGSFFSFAGYLLLRFERQRSLRGKSTIAAGGVSLPSDR